MTFESSAPHGPIISGVADSKAFLSAGPVLDHDALVIRSYVADVCRGTLDDARSIAVALYYAVRDGISYEIFGCYLGEKISASLCLEKGRGFCLHKAILYAACCRAAGIPCRLLSANVRNHINSPSITALVGGEVFLHWYNEVLIEGEWIKAAPIFNRLTCKMYGIQPLEFDGFRDAAAQPYRGGRTMEFLAAPVCFVNPSAGDLLEAVARQHPNMLGPNEHVPTRRDLTAAANNGRSSTPKFACTSNRGGAQ